MDKLGWLKLLMYIYFNNTGIKRLYGPHNIYNNLLK